MKSKKYIYTIIALLFSISFYIYDNYYSENKEESTVVSESDIKNSNKQEFLPTSTTGTIVKHHNYTLSYSEPHEQAEWVAYNLTASNLSNTHFKRPFFEVDKAVKTKSAHYKDYKNSGYDKGHLCPAGDRRYSKQAHDETFLMSNVSPQNHQFNAGLWNRLEQKTRYWAKKYKGIYVVTGGILTDDNLKHIGRSKVAVPKRYYKIIYDYTEPDIKAIGFIMPAKDSDAPLYKYVKNIDEIEKITHIDFFPSLPDELEDKLESSSDYKKWF